MTSTNADISSTSPAPSSPSSASSASFSPPSFLHSFPPSTSLANLFNSPSHPKTTSTVLFPSILETLGGILGDSADYLAVCLASGSGDILSVIGGDTTATLEALQESI